MTTARSPRRAVLVGAALLVALGGLAPVAAAGTMAEGQDRKAVKKTIPVVWTQSAKGNRGIPIVVSGPRGPRAASIVRSGSIGRDDTVAASAPTLIEVSSSGAVPVQMTSSWATRQSPGPIAIQVPKPNAIEVHEPTENAIPTNPPVTRSAPLRGVQVYLGNESGSDTEARSLQDRFPSPQVDSGSDVRTATWDPPPPPRQSSTPSPQSSTIPATRVTATDDDPGDYRLGAGDMIDVFVWRNPELSRKVPVRPDGRISLPLVGEMVATGKTTRQVQDEITAILGQYIQVPTVTVTVTEIRSLVVYVVGNVGKPGPLQLNRNVTVLQAISMAGGLNEFANKNDITILRTVNGQQQRIPFRYGDFVKGKAQGPEILLRAGDVVYVP